MKKSVKCYGRKKTVDVKDNSLVRNFFDGNKSSDDSLFATCSDKKLQENSYNKNKEGTASNVLESPALFKYSQHDDFTTERSDELESSTRKNTNVHRAPKIKKRAKPKKNVRKKQIQHLSTKFCKSRQPRWSQFYNHDFTVEKGSNFNCPPKQYGNENLSRGTLKPILTGNSNGLSENPNAVNIDKNDDAFFETQKFSKYVTSTLWEISCDLNSSAELFVKNKKKRNITKNKDCVLNDKRKCNEEYAITKGMKPDFAVTNLKGNKRNLNEQETENKASVKMPFVLLSDIFASCTSSDFVNNSSHLPFQNVSSGANINRDDSFEDISREDSAENNSIKKVSEDNALLSAAVTELNDCCTSSTSYATPMIKKGGDFTKKSGNSIKHTSYIGSPLNMTGFSPDVPKTFRDSHLLEKKKIGKFVTSTPVVKFSGKDARNGNVNSIVSNSHAVASLRDENDLVEDCMLLTSTKEKTHKTLSQFDGNPLTCSPRKLLTNPKPISLLSLSSQSSRSTPLNLSFCDVPPAPEESKDFIKAEILKVCNQESVAAFDSIYAWSQLKVKKIGEGSYGEVFMITKRKCSSVLKIMCVSKKSGDGYQELQSVLSEIQISKCLSELRNNKRNKTRNFVRVKKASFVSGSYPTVLINAWDDFLRGSKSCFNDRPDQFDDDQLFAILELEYGGKDMSHIRLKNSVEAESILKQITVSLAIAEEEHLFEHRDLHLGNILLQRNHKKKMSYKLRGKDISFDCHGVQVTLIDFTFSRLYKDGFIYYNDLANDKSLFEQTGDFQYDVYKYMKQYLENRWHECSLYSNVLWLKYLCEKLKERGYSRPSTAVHKEGLKTIELFSFRLMACNCATECLTKCKITKHLFEAPSFDSSLTKKSVLISRNSSKSKLT